jgi:hypothetical protein
MALWGGFEPPKERERGKVGRRFTRGKTATNMEPLAWHEMKKEQGDTNTLNP